MHMRARTHMHADSAVLMYRESVCMCARACGAGEHIIMPVVLLFVTPHMYMYTGACICVCVRCIRTHYHACYAAVCQITHVHIFMREFMHACGAGEHIMPGCRRARLVGARLQREESLREAL